MKDIAETLKATLDPGMREPAEKHLDEIHKIIGFAPTILQCIMNEEVEMPVRQAGGIYMKNMVMQYWAEREPIEVGDPVPFSIHENDKNTIRNNIVEATIQAPEPIRVQLAVLIQHIVKHDYPGKWPGIVDKVMGFLMQNENTDAWLGALLVLYQLVKNYEYKKPEERGPLNVAMQQMLPLLHSRCVQLLPDASEKSVLNQKQILKIFYALVQYFLPLDLITKEIFASWMELVRQIADRPVPEACDQVEEEDRPELAWWKCKKWALHIIVRIFERYGSPGNVTSDYNEFSEYYLKNFTGPIIQILLKILYEHKEKRYVSPRVLQQTVNYLNHAVKHAHSWKFLKPHMFGIIQEIIFPLLCHSEADEDLFETDPYEYIRVKFDVFEEFVSPSTAAQTLLHSAVVKRKDMLSKTMGFCVQVLNNSADAPRQKDGILHMIGSLADILLKKKIYKDQMELMLVTHVFPEFQSPHGFLRARACWVLHYFSDIKFKNPGNLKVALDMVRTRMCEDKDLPVKVEAAIALQMMLSGQDEAAQELIQPHVKQVVLTLLDIIRETENDDLTTVLQKIVCTYVDEVMPIAVEMTDHLAKTFQQVVDSDEGTDDKAVTAMGILNTIETILTVMEDQKEIMSALEAIVLSVVGTILQGNVMEFYEEVMSIIYSLTCTAISSHMWQVFHLIYEMFQKDGYDFFTEMMPALHNYVTVDTKAFLANPTNMEVIYNMCKGVLTGDSGEDAESHAAKLLEVVLIQCKGQVDSAVPLFVELALQRLTKEVKTSELRTMCLQVVIAAIYYNPALLLETLEKMHLPNSTESITAQFLKQWLHDTDCFLGLHDRKLAVLGLSALLETSGSRPQVIQTCADQIVPSILTLFSGLKRAYAARAAAENSDDDSDEEASDDDLEVEELGSDEDDIDEEGVEYIEKLQKTRQSMEAEDDEEEDDDDEEDDGDDETALENYNTPLDEDDCDIDEYVIFKTVLNNLQANHPELSAVVMSRVDTKQRKELEEVFTLADQRLAAKQSRDLEKKGGYQFASTEVPNTFNFLGGVPTGINGNVSFGSK